MKKDVVLCKIISADKYEVKYKLIDNPDGPLFVMANENVFKFSMASGFSQEIYHEKETLIDKIEEIAIKLLQLQVPFHN